MKGNKVIQKICFTTASFLKNNGTTILAILGAAGVVGTAVLVAKETPAANQKLGYARDIKGDDLTIVEETVTVAKCYAPAAACGAVTIACIIGSNVLSRKQQASLIAAYTMLNQSYHRYKEEAKKLYGENADKEILAEAAKENSDNIPPWIDKTKQLFYEEITDEYFESTIEDVMAAEYHLNRNFVLRGYADFNEFLKFLGIPERDGAEEIGWSMDIGFDFYGYSWVDFKHDTVQIDDGLECTIISYPFMPTADYLSP